MLVIILFKFNLVCEVTVNGESVGYIADKESFEAQVNEIINRETGGRIYVKDLNLDSRLWYDGDGQFDTAIIDIHQRDISFVEKCFEGCCRIVKEGGEILLCVSMEAILSEETAAMRDRLKREQMLSEVIQLPSGNILLHIIMSPQESFIMCNAKKLSKKITYSNRIVVDKEAFMKEMELAKRGETLIVRRYEYERLDSNILIPMYYITEGVSVAELTNTISETVLSDECCKEEKVVTINHLSKVFTKSGFSVDGLSALRQDRLRRYYRVNGPAVIIAVSKKDIAVGYTTDTAPFLVPDNLYVMIPKEGIDVRYLAGKLLSKSIKEQVVTLIRSHGLDKFIETKLIPGWTKIVRMGLDSSEGQQQFIHEISMKEFAEQEKEAITQEKRFRHSIRLRKHALIQNVSAFESLFHSLEYYMAEHSGAIIKPEDKLSTVSQMTVGEAMKILHKDLATISDRIERLTDGNDWGKCEIIEPQEFIESYEKQHTSTDFRFENGWTPLLYNDWLNKVLGITRDSGFNNNTYQEDELDEKTGKLLHYEGEPKYAAWFPRKALEQVLDNIVANARAHGFKDKSRKDYAIEADWKTDGLNMIISISNNGEPLPSDVDTDLVLEYGYTTALNQEGHGGIGGGEIAEIMRKFGGSARVTSTPDSDYTVTYELTMPLASDY